VYRISEIKEDMDYKLQISNERRNKNKFLQANHNSDKQEYITSKTTLIYGLKIWVLNKKGNQHFEAPQTKFLRLLLEFAKVGHQRHTDVR
jgi:hypothetical protein